MTGYQEVMTDPSYARQMVAFTFPHIGNVGANAEDVEAKDPHALGCIVREAVTGPASFRVDDGFPELDARQWADRPVGGRHARADPPGPQGGPADGGLRPSRQRRVRPRRAAASWRPSGPASKAWTWPRKSAASSSRRGAAASGGWASGYSSSAAAIGRSGRMSSPSTMAPSATSSATWSRPGRR